MIKHWIGRCKITNVNIDDIFNKEIVTEYRKIFLLDYKFWLNNFRDYKACFEYCTWNRYATFVSENAKKKKKTDTIQRHL